MTADIPIAEMQDDLRATERDIDRLSSILENLEAFIRDSGGEDRSAFRMDAFKYRALLSQADTLKKAIQDRIRQAKP